MTQPRERARYIVATNWNDVTNTYSALIAFANITTSTTPATLVIVVPDTPTQKDIDMVSEIMAGLVRQGSSFEGLDITVESFIEACQKPFKSCITPQKASKLASAQIATFCASLHKLSLSSTLSTLGNVDLYNNSNENHNPGTRLSELLSTFHESEPESIETAWPKIELHSRPLVGQLDDQGVLTIKEG